MNRSLAMIGLLLIGLACSGAMCRQHVVVIDRNADVVRLGKGVRGEVFVLKEGKWVSVGKAELPAGWYAGPGPE